MTTTAAETDVPDQAFVARGRRIFLAVAVVFVALEALRALAMPYTDLDIMRVLLGIGLFYAAWFGQQWAIALLALGLPVGALFSFILGFASLNVVGFAIGVAMAVLYSGLFVLFVKSESLNAFFRQQGPRPAEELAERTEATEAETTGSEPSQLD
jgi:hypothetical protein